jgi:Flp pilus assembly protein TadD
MKKHSSIFLTALAILILLNGCGKKTDTPVRTYSGSASCKECHERFYKLWEPSHHGKALQPWSADLAKAIPPQPEPIEAEGRFYMATITPERGWVTDDEGAEYDIIYTLGGKNYYNLLTLLPDGRLQVLPIFYNVREQKWENTTLSMLRHFDDGRTDAPISWRDSMLTFNAACFSCHVSMAESNYDPETDTYATTWKEAGISCESCHGPSSEHIRVCKAAPKGTVPENLELIGWWDMNLEERNSACAGCHTKGGPVSVGYETGDRYWDHYDLTTFENADYYPDGRDLGENYTMGSWLISPCVTKGDLACTHCHTSSGRDKYKNNPNNACVSCHQKRVENVKKHSRHEELTCVACHMPMSPFGGMNQSDHSMRPPMPNLSKAVGSRNACVMCHDDKDNDWALQNIKKWHPDFEEHTAHEMERALLVKAMSEGDWDKLPAVLAFIKNPDSDPLFATTLIRQLPPSGDPAQHAILQKLVTDSAHPLVRSAAATALDADNNPADRPALFAALSDDYRLVRVRAAERLIALPEIDIPKEHRAAFDASAKEMWTSTNLRQDNWGSHFNAANILMRQDRLEEAAAKYDRAHQLRDDIPQPLINGSMAFAQLGNLAEAETRLLKATQLPEPSAEAHFNLGLLYAEQGKTAEAEKALYQCLEIQPTNAQAAYNLAILMAGKNYPECFRLLDQAIKADPYNPRYVQTLAFYYVQTRQPDLAKKVIEQGFERGVNSAEIQSMYRQLR